MKKIIILFLFMFFILCCNSCSVIKEEKADVENMYNTYFKYKLEDYKKLFNVNVGKLIYIKSEDVSDKLYNDYYYAGGEFIDGIFFDFNVDSNPMLICIIASYKNPYRAGRHHAYQGQYSVYKNCLYLGTNIENEYFENIKISGDFITNKEGNILLNAKNQTNFKTPDEIIKINPYAFFNDPSITSLVCGDNLQSVGEWAFSYSDNLKTVVFNDDIVCIGYCAFWNCKNLEYVIIPDTLTYINSCAFNYGNIYCESYTFKTTWTENFAIENAKIYLKGEWEYDENGVPYVLGE